MSGVGPTLIHYEVYLYDSGRWTLHARYRREERDIALEEAREAERSLGMPAKVVREAYNPQDNESEESTVYISDRARFHGRTAGLRSAAAQNWASAGPAAQAIEGESPASAFFRNIGAQQTATVGALSRIVAVLAGSAFGAALVTALLSTLVGRLPLRTSIFFARNLDTMQFLSFVVVFLLLAAPLSRKLIHRGGGESTARRPPPRREARPRPAPAEPEPEPPLVEPHVAEAAALADEPEAPAIGEEEVAETLPMESEAAAPDGADATQAAQATLMRFLQTLLSEIARVRPQLDNYNRFGISLMLAGAVEWLADRDRLDEEAKRATLQRLLEIIGTKTETARLFAGKLDGYLLEQRYLGMVQAGRYGLEAFLDGNAVALGSMGSLFEAWNRPQSPQAKATITTVMFTDMVGSTNLTQERGDASAQNIVRRHNSIVRAALTQFGGKEVKHTGDGIMAAFASTANGVEAAIAIQRAVALDNGGNHDNALHLRVGLNAGEPIEEEDDLFGTTVQLAARVCAFAERDQIICTNVVRELAAGKGIAFVPKGAHALKGFPDRRPLYEVLWDPRLAPGASDAHAGAGAEG